MLNFPLVRSITKLFIILALLVCTNRAVASHVVGGEMFYENMGIGPGGGYNYRVTLRLFKEAASGVALPGGQVAVRVNENNAAFTVITTANLRFVRFDTLTLTMPPPCIINPPPVSYEMGLYVGFIELPINTNGYILSFQQCCRINAMENINGSGSGYTYSTIIPGTDQLGAATNNSPVVNLKDTVLICAGKTFALDFGAVDSDGDSLAYQFCGAYNNSPVNPPFNTLNYKLPYTASQPGGADVTIDPQTGLIAGFINTAGSYVVCVCIGEYRNGVQISTHRKDFNIKVSDCATASAVLPAGIQECNSFTLNFLNLAPSPINQTFFWDFGVTTLSNDTAIVENPAYTYPDSGIYLVKFYVNRGIDCPDSTSTIVKVYPGMDPGFIPPAFGCVNTSMQFTDTSKVRYGNIVRRSWDMGEPGHPDNYQLTNNPVIAYQTPGVKTVALTIETDLGCTSTTTRQVTVTAYPQISLAFSDSLICNLDSAQLSATVNTGTVSWSPNYNIINPATVTPTVFPKITTEYIIAANNDGCVTRDTILMRLLPTVQLQTSNDTAICPGTFAYPWVTGNAKSYHWTPINRIANPDTSHIVARPVEDTWFKVTGTYNNCSTTDSVRVAMLPLPDVYAGPDTLICYGGSFINPIIATGDEFWWNYTGGIDNSSSFTPRFTPTHSYRYILNTRNRTGCTRVNSDTIFVRVYRAFKTEAGPDQVMVTGQSVQLQGSASGTLVQWIPGLGLSNATIFNPIASPPQTQLYTLKVTDADGCFDTDTVRVTVYHTQPDIFVAGAFTPNGDGVNDVLKAVPVGITKFEYFKVFNRWGGTVFSTGDHHKGWDGTIRNSNQETDTYIWMARGIDYKGNVVTRKGTVVVIR